MCTQTQKHFDTLFAALQKHLTESPWNAQHGYLLIDAQKRAQAGSQQPHPSEWALNDLRSRVCSVCRSNTLYACDAYDGWSPNCALVRNKT